MYTGTDLAVIMEKRLFPTEQMAVMALLKLYPKFRPIMESETAQERLYKLTSAELDENSCSLRDLVKESYNLIGYRYLFSRNQRTADVPLVQELIKRLPKGSKALDAGCGPGLPITKILSEHFETLGIDFSVAQLELAQELVPHAKFLCKDITSLDFPDNEFDALCCYYTIVHIPRSEHKSLLKNFYRMIKPGGLALLCLGVYDMPDIVYNYLGNKMLWSHYDSNTNLQITKKSGFSIVEKKIVGENTLAAHLFVLAQK